MLFFALLLPASAATTPDTKHTAHTQAKNQIRGVVITAPAHTTLLAQALRSLRGMPLTPPVQEIARQRLVAIAAQHGWQRVDIVMADQLDDDGSWAITVSVAQLPARSAASSITPPSIAPNALRVYSSSLDTMRKSRQFSAWERADHYRVLIARQTRTLYLKRGGDVLEFSVGVGRARSPTPTGGFTVQAIAQQPTWFPTKNIRARAAARGRELPRSIPPGPGNPLGNWFVAIGQSIGIHGTDTPASIGRFVSSGCVRMQNADIDVVAQSLRAGDGVLVVDALDTRAEVPVPQLAQRPTLTAVELAPLPIDYRPERSTRSSVP